VVTTPPNKVSGNRQEISIVQVAAGAGATLSEPQSDTADNIARKFLERHNSLFAHSGRASSEELN
jgi:hypothetical protein